MNSSGIRRAIICLAVSVLCLSSQAQDPSGVQAPANGFDSVRASAEAARNAGDAQTALQLYAKAVELNPSWPDGWWFLGTMEYGMDQYQQAAQALTHFIHLTPQAGPAMALRGLCEFETAQYPQSLADIQNGIAAGALNQPRNAIIVLYHEALLLTRLGRFEEALVKYTALIKQGQGNPELATAVGLAGLRMALLPADIDPTQMELITATGQAAMAVMAGDIPGGRQQFDAIFRQYPTQKNVHYLLGYLLFPTDNDAAIAEFQEEDKLSPDSAVAHAMTAWAMGFTGNYAGALPDAQKAEEEDPKLTIAQLVYGRALIETGNLPAGIPLLEQVTQQEPGNLEAHISLAKAYSKSGRPEDARRERLVCLSISEQGAPQVVQ